MMINLHAVKNRRPELWMPPRRGAPAKYPWRAFHGVLDMPRFAPASGETKAFLMTPTYSCLLTVRNATATCAFLPTARTALHEDPCVRPHRCTPTPGRRWRLSSHATTSLRGERSLQFPLPVVLRALATQVYHYCPSVEPAWHYCWPFGSCSSEAELNQILDPHSVFPRSNYRPNRRLSPLSTSRS